MVSCGPGYLVSLLREVGYTNVRGIDSDPEKMAHARRRQLPCETAQAFAYLEQNHEPFDVIIPEQELNHLTLDEQLEFLSLCLRNLRPGGLMIVYGLNGANPLVGLGEPRAQHRSLQHLHRLQPAIRCCSWRASPTSR